MVVGPNKNEVDGQPTKASLDLYNRNLTWVFTTESHSFFPSSQKGPCNNAAYYRSSSKPSPKGFEVIMKVSVHWGKWKYPGFSGIPKHYSEMILILRNPKCHCRPLVKIWAYSGQRMRRVAQSPLIMICDSRIHQKWYLGGLVSHMGGNPWYNDKFGKKKKKRTDDHNYGWNRIHVWTRTKRQQQKRKYLCWADEIIGDFCLLGLSQFLKLAQMLFLLLL